MPEKVDKGLSKKELIDALSDREVTALVSLLNVAKVSSEYHREYLLNQEARLIFGVLHLKIFGAFDGAKSKFQVILENIPKVRAILASIPVPPPKVSEKKKQIPEMPRNLWLDSQSAGRVFVSEHAWQRFCERFLAEPTRFSQKEIADRLQRTFSGAIKSQLEKVEAVLRRINNNFQEADYYYNQQMGCRFVVASKNGRSILKTVERPRSRRGA